MHTTKYQRALVFVIKNHKLNMGKSKWKNTGKRSTLFTLKFIIVSKCNFSWIRTLTEKGAFEIKALKPLGRLLSQGSGVLLIRWSWVRIPPDPPLY